MESVKSILEKQALEAGFKKIDCTGEEFFQWVGEQFLVRVSFRDCEDTDHDCVYISFEVTAYNVDFHYDEWEIIDSDDAKSSSCFNEKLSGVFQEIAKELADSAFHLNVGSMLFGKRC